MAICILGSITHKKFYVFTRKNNITTVSKEKLQKKVVRDDGGFQQQSPQRLLHRYDHMNSRNDRWTMWLKPIQREYYSIENQKSFGSTM